MSDPSAAELAALRAELVALREEVARLHDDLRGARQRIDLTLRGQLRCPACGGRKIAHAPQVLDRADSATRAALALYQPSWWSSKVVGELEAYACVACGLVEWWVREPGALAEHDKYLRILDGAEPGAGGPYRGG
ncbi:MAG: hypothetical protein KBG28_25525 [Kofleriaceae bacterium]|jgi:hypothetical protein|nr:hypothetical protein [Kofleriaceae bacterium]MBP6836642.1 hypothetical protein [Kofleriaceae bacterium]MBP9207356.1 hypothetical protein [Kofleriaceae bacterium]